MGVVVVAAGAASVMMNPWGGSSSEVVSPVKPLWKLSVTTKNPLLFPSFLPLALTCSHSPEEGVGGLAGLHRFCELTGPSRLDAHFAPTKMCLGDYAYLIHLAVHYFLGLGVPCKRIAHRQLMTLPAVHKFNGLASIL